MLCCRSRWRLQTSGRRWSGFLFVIRNRWRFIVCGWGGMRRTVCSVILKGRSVHLMGPWFVEVSRTKFEMILVAWSRCSNTSSFVTSQEDQSEIGTSMWPIYFFGSYLLDKSFDDLVRSRYLLEARSPFDRIGLIDVLVVMEKEREASNLLRNCLESEILENLGATEYI